MILLRSVVYFIAMVITVTAFGVLLATVGWLLPVGFTDAVARAWGRVNLWLQHVICGLGYRIKGAEHLPDGPCIVMSKHQSAWETIALRAIIRPQQSWVLKKELLNIPVFGWCLRLAKSIPIDRSAGRRAVLKVVEDGSARLAEGRSVIIFPEGTRTAPGQRKKYGIGGGVLAERTGTPIVPIAHNAGIFWRRRGVKKYPGTVQLVVGAPIKSDGKKATEIMREVEAWIEGEQKKLPGEVSKT
jgi:1-acyl-sn-glycerol-3-phosphate acyltransferase